MEINRPPQSQLTVTVTDPERKLSSEQTTTGCRQKTNGAISRTECGLRSFERPMSERPSVGCIRPVRVGDPKSHVRGYVTRALSSLPHADELSLEFAVKWNQDPTVRERNG